MLVVVVEEEEMEDILEVWVVQVVEVMAVDIFPLLLKQHLMLL
jgi:hypothetical protein